MIQPCLTTEQFLELRPELPESGQWAELVEGVPVLLQPPDFDHGTVVLNLSKKLAEYFSSQPAGYSCFDLGLQLSAAPDTVLFPAISIYLDGPRFGHTDEEVSRTPPRLVIDLLSTADRQAQAISRAVRFLTWGIADVWQIHCQSRLVSLWHVGQEPRKLRTADVLADSNVLPGFEIPVTSLFAEPVWYLGNR